MRLTEKKLRRVIKEIIVESQFDGTMNPEDPLEYFIEYEYMGQSPGGARQGRMKFSEVMEILNRDGIGRYGTADDVLVAIAAKPEKYALDGCVVIFKEYS